MAIAEIERRQKEGHTSSREILWFPDESAAKRVSPGGLVKTRVTYPEGEEHKKVLVGPEVKKTALYEEVHQLVGARPGIDLNLELLKFSADRAWVEGKTSTGVRTFLHMMKVAGAQAEPSWIRQLIAVGTEVLHAAKEGMKTVLLFLAGEASVSLDPAAVPHIPVPIENAGHPRVVATISGWVMEADPMSHVGKFVLVKAVAVHDLYTENYVDYLYGKVQWGLWSKMPQTAKTAELNSYNRIKSGRGVPFAGLVPGVDNPMNARGFAGEAYRARMADASRRSSFHEWLGWAARHRWDHRNPPPDPRKAAFRRAHYDHL